MAGVPDVLVGAGNIARCGKTAPAATAALLDMIPGTVFTAGDNIYSSGSASDFASCYDPTWGRFKAGTRPAVGDKDYKTAGASGYFGYFGAAAGDPAKGYYSYDLTDWHVIVLNSGSSSISTKLGSPQELWLRADLAANTKRCTLAYWHHQRFSSSGTAVRSVVKPLWDDLYAAHADLVVNAHARVYERFAPQTPAGAADPQQGIREFIVGTGGQGVDTFNTTVTANSEVRSSGTYGVLKLTLGAGTFAWNFIPIAGQTFTDAGSGSCHGAMPVASVNVSPASGTIQVGDAIQLTATPLDAAGNALSGRAVTWQTSDPSVAGVSSTGRVTGVAVGTATITATSEGVSGSSLITVTAASAGPAVLVGAGDIADCGSSGDEATASLLDNIAGAVFTAGDNAYPDGSATDYSQCYDPSWGRHKARTHPAPGNHDYTTAGAPGYFGYYGALAGDAGKGYYSYDLGDWHVVSLNSEIDMTVGSLQEQWLRADLATSTKSCTIAYWHRPRFSSGTHHGSSFSTEPLWQALYAAGAEIVFSGHEHNYERFAPQTPGGLADPAAGIREIVSGTGGESHYNDQGPPLANSEVFNGTTWGVLELTLAAGSYSWRFIPISGQTFTDAGNGTCHNAPSTLTTSTSSIAASTGSSSATITVTARDASGNPVSGASVVLFATGSSNTIVQPGPTDANGVTIGTLSSTVAEAKTVTATIGGVAVTEAATVTVKPGTAAALAFAVQPTSTTAGSPITPAVQVEVRDALGNRVITATNTVTMALGSNASGATLAGAKSVMAVAGVATFNDLSLDLTGSGYTLLATSGTLTNAASTKFDITGGAVSASLSTVTVDQATIPAGTSVAAITVTVRDGSGAAVSGMLVTLSASGNGNTLTQPGALTDANGVARGSLSSTGAGQKTVTAVAGGITLTQQPIVTVMAGPADAARSTLIAQPTAIAQTTGMSTITVTVKDAYGNPVSGSTVVLNASGTGNTISQPPSTGANGVTTGSLSSSDPQTETVSATADGVAIAQTASVTVTAGPPPAVISHQLLTSGNNTTNQTTYTTASIAPAANTLITVAVLSQQSTAVAPDPTVSGGGMAGWDVVKSVVFDSPTTPHQRVTIYRAMSGAPGTGPLTIKFSVNVSHAEWIVSQWSGVVTTGSNGADAIIQTGSTAANAVNGLTVALAPLSNSYNVAFGVFGVVRSTTAVTPGAGFTEIDEQPSAEGTTSASDLEAEWAVNLNLVNAIWANLNGGAVAIELKAAN